MKKQLMKKWVKALRSKKFEQGTGTLREAGDNGIVRYCCLGVLATVCGYKPIDIDGCADLGDVYATESDKWDDTPICELKDREGTPDKGEVKIRIKNIRGTFSSLAIANDEGASFRSIASWIEKNYRKL